MSTIIGAGSVQSKCFEGEKNMLRSFLPIGQGAFYREVFRLRDGRHTIIYDCGSTTDQAIVERQIIHDFSEDEIIDAVFISHLDEDHINGLPFLLKHCLVKNLFFPLITTKDKVYLKLKALLSVGRNGFLYHFIQNPYDALRNIDAKAVPRLYQIGHRGDEDWNDVDARRIVSGDNVANLLGFHQSEFLYWELIPFNFRQQERVDTLKKSLAHEFHCDLEQLDEIIEDIIMDYSRNKDRIRNAYRHVSGSFNTNSMTLFSGIREHYIRQFGAVFKRQYDPCCCSKESGCLYLGDYDASGKHKWDALKRAYDKYWAYVGCIQIPHHGSSHNYNEEFSKLDAIHVISAGYRNQYRHPHSSVIKDLTLNDCRVHIVSENIGSQLDLKVNCF